MSQAGKTASSTPGSNNVSQFNKFLNNNTQFLHQKYLLYYVVPFPLAQLTSKENLDKTVKFIYDIFSFSKYESDDKLNQTLRKSLVDNVGGFVKESTQGKPGESFLFDNTLSIKMLKYCIENNDMFAVHYDKKNPPPKQQATQPAQIQEKSKRAQESEESVQQDKQPEQIGESILGPAPQKQINISDKNQSGIFSLGQNQFDVPQSLKQADKEVIKKQMKLLFDFYCKQQQNIGKNSTFDKISQNCQAMTLGKFVAFANACNLAFQRRSAYSQAKIDKNVLVSTFKRVSQGKKQIGFDLFFDIFQELGRLDDKIVSRLGLGEDGSHGINKLKDQLKYFSLPFNTRDPFGRQTAPHKRIFIPKLTAHSGKIEGQLREQLLIRKQKKQNAFQNQTAPSKLHTAHEARLGSSKHLTKSPIDNNNLTLKANNPDNNQNGNDLSFLANLITSEDNDEQFLQDYKLPLGKQTPHQNRASINNRHQDSGRYTNLQLQRKNSLQLNLQKKSILTSRQSRQQAMIPQMQKRIKQLQSTEKRQISKFQKRSFGRSLIKS